MAPASKTDIRIDTAAFAALGPGQLRAGQAVDAVDGITPRLVLTPRNEAQAADAVAEARAQGLAIIPTGGRTAIHTGNVPSSHDVRLSTTGMSQEIEPAPDDLVVRAQAGVTIARLNRQLAQVGQRVAVDPAVPDRSTVGGIVAGNRTGGLRQGFGLPRDQVLGMRVIDGTGRNYGCGGRVVKNVAGFDLPRLITGSWGSLAVICDVTLRTHPIPETGTTLIFPCDGPKRLEILRRRLAASNLQPVAADFAVDIEGTGSYWTVALRFEGTRAVVDGQVAAATKLFRKEPAEADPDWWSPAHAEADAPLVLRIGVDPALSVRAADTVYRRLAARIHGMAMGGHLGDGVVRVWGSAGEKLETFQTCLVAREITEELGGRLVLESLPVEAKSRQDIWGEEPAGLDVMRAIKARFDPDGVLTPGRLWGGI